LKELEEVEKILSAEQVKKEIEQGKTKFQGVTIKGNLYLAGETFNDFYFSDINLDGDLCFTLSTIRGFVNFYQTRIEGETSFKESILKGRLFATGCLFRNGFTFEEGTSEDEVVLDKITTEVGVSFGETAFKGSVGLYRSVISGNLDFDDTIIECSLYIINTIIEGELDLSTKKGPKKIYVSPELKEVVHLAAPTIPLVIVKDTRGIMQQ
jgi:hypothetical protein